MKKPEKMKSDTNCEYEFNYIRGFNRAYEEWEKYHEHIQASWNEQERLTREVDR